MAKRLTTIIHDLKTNTLEATWEDDVVDSDGEIIETRRVECRSYSKGQRDDFDADTRTTKYSIMAKWDK